jgi:hypothetical protein
MSWYFACVIRESNKILEIISSYLMLTQYHQLDKKGSKDEKTVFATVRFGCVSGYVRSSCTGGRRRRTLGKNYGFGRRMAFTG